MREHLYPSGISNNVWNAFSTRLILFKHRTIVTKMCPWKMASASNKVVKSLLHQAVKLCQRSEAAAYPFTKNKPSCYILVGNFSVLLKT